jgi:hypothetical protein
MNAALRTTLLRETRPADAGDVRVTMEGPGWRLCWIKQGRIEEPFGPIWLHLSQAHQAAVELRMAHNLG